jgi:2-polyprenyl-3-methyl-5-hydroxy-6-metoxy-1,4-benzoquinol methylase
VFSDGARLSLLAPNRPRLPTIIVETWTETEYWNHNSAYHLWIVRLAAQHRGHALDVGCGEGLLVQRLATVSRWVTGIDPDSGAIARARRRTTGLTNVTMEEIDFIDFEANAGSFDVVTFVASLHHLDLAVALAKARALVRPGGEIIVVGLAANKTAIDWMISGLMLPFVRLGSCMHHEARDVGVAATDARENLGEIRATVQCELPGASVRRALYYRYLLRWRKA